MRPYRIVLPVLAFALSALGTLPAAAAPAPLPAPPPDAPPGSATTYQVNNTHEGLTDTTLRPPLTRAWSTDLGGRVGYPLMVNGRIFATAASSGGGTLLWALDAADGTVLWGPKSLGGTYRIEGIAADGANVYGVNSSGLVTAWNQVTGQPVWSAQMPSQWMFTSPPTVHAGTVYVVGAGSGGTLFALDASNGTVKWSGGVMNGDHSSPAVTDDGVYVSFACGVTYRFDPLTGASTWVRRTGCEGGGGSTPVVHDGRVYVRDFLHQAVLDAANGTATGTFAATAAPTFDGEVSYQLQGSTLRAVDLSTGDVLWSQAADGTLSSAPIVVGSDVAIGSTSGRVFLVDKTDGSVAWSGDTGAPVLAPDEHSAMQLAGLAASGDRLVVPATNALVAFGPASAADYVVEALYTDLLGRHADPDGLAWWSGLLQHGTSQLQVATALATSPEALRLFVSQDYEQILGRSPDPAGLAYWSDRMADGSPTHDPAPDLAASAEFYDSAGGTPRAWVRALYLHLLGRQASESEVTYWAGTLATAGRTAVAHVIFGSPESATHQISELYQSLLGRAVDPAGLAFFRARFATMGWIGTEAALCGSAEYATHAQP